MNSLFDQKEVPIQPIYRLHSFLMWIVNSLSNCMNHKPIKSLPAKWANALHYVELVTYLPGQEKIMETKCMSQCYGHNWGTSAVQKDKNDDKNSLRSTVVCQMTSRRNPIKDKNSVAMIGNKTLLWILGIQNNQQRMYLPAINPTGIVNDSLATQRYHRGLYTTTPYRQIHSIITQRITTIQLWYMVRKK